VRFVRVDDIRTTLPDHAANTAEGREGEVPAAERLGLNIETRLAGAARQFAGAVRDNLHDVPAADLAERRQNHLILSAAPLRRRVDVEDLHDRPTLEERAASFAYFQ
jgi:hypothetical protein